MKMTVAGFFTFRIRVKYGCLNKPGGLRRSLDMDVAPLMNTDTQNNMRARLTLSPDKEHRSQIVSCDGAPCAPNKMAYDISQTTTLRFCLRKEDADDARIHKSAWRI